MQQFLEKTKGFDMGEIPFAPEDFEKLASSYAEIQKLVADYASSYSRIQTAEQINEKITTLQTFLTLCEQNLKCMMYDAQDIKEFVTDRLLAMQLLVRLANIDCDKYELKLFHAADSPSFVGQHIPLSNIWVIGEKDVLSTLCTGTYYDSAFGNVVTKLVHTRHPLIIATDHRHRNNIIPYSYYENKLYTSWGVSDISYFTFKDELSDAVTKFTNWTSKNGADIKGLDEDTLFELMKNY